MHEIWSFLYVVKSHKEEGAECGLTLYNKKVSIFKKIQDENIGFVED